jgi:hypothetical protein
MLQKLKDFGVANGYFEEKKICNFENAENEGLSLIKTKAIEFDKTSKKISERYKWSSRPSSCDALKIIVPENRFDFLEFKQRKITEIKEIKNKEDYDNVKKNIFVFLNLKINPDLKNKSNLSFLFDMCWKEIDEAIFKTLRGIEGIEKNLSQPKLRELSQLDKDY